MAYSFGATNDEETLGANEACYLYACALSELDVGAFSRSSWELSTLHNKILL